MSPRSSIQMDGMKKQADVEHLENPQDAWIQAYPLLREKSEEELKAIRKSLLRKLDWRFLPTVTVMLLMG